MGGGVMAVVASVCGSGAAIACIGFATQSNADLSTAERYGVLGLLSIVVVGIGGGGLKLLMRLNESITANTSATRDLAHSIAQLVQQNQEAHRDYSIARDKAVADVTGAISGAETRIIRELERRRSDGKE